MISDETPSDHLTPDSPVPVAPVCLLGGLGVDGFDEMLAGGVYALVPQSPPARFPVWARLLMSAVATGRVCHVLLRTDPAEFLSRLESGGWQGATAAWMDETLRIYPMVDGFAKLLFRRDVGEFTEELIHWGVQANDFLLVDAGDELLSLHDLFLATGQIIKLKTWVRSMQLPVLLNFSLAGAGSGMGSLTSLMDHFSGMARLHSDEYGSLLTLEYWQSALGTVAERTVYLNGQPEQKSQTAETRPTAFAPPVAPLFSPSAAPAPRSTVMPLALSGAGHVPAMAPPFSDDTPSHTAHFTNDQVWARELQLLTGDAWQAKSSAQDMVDSVDASSACQIVLRYARSTDLEALARDIHRLRTHLPASRILVAEHRAALRYPNERMLMKLGADAVIHNDMNMGRWPSVLKSIQSQPVRKFETLSIEAVFANASSSERMGYLELPDFLPEVQELMRKAHAMDVPFAMAVLSARNGWVSPDFIEAAQIRRQGDLLTSDGQRLFVFFYACSLTMGPQILDNVFGGHVGDYATDVDWVASELDIHYLIQHLEKHGGIRPSQAEDSPDAVIQSAVDTQFDDTVVQIDQDVPDAVEAESEPQADFEQEPEPGCEPEQVPEPQPDWEQDPQSALALDMPDAPQVAEPDSVDSVQTTETENPDELHPSPFNAECVDGAVVAEADGLEEQVEETMEDEAAHTPVSAEPVLEPVDVSTVLEAAPPEIALTPKGGLLLPKKLAMRVDEVVPHVPPDTPLVIVPDRRKGRAAGNGVAERRVAELVRRLAQPASHHNKPPPPPSDPTDLA